ncbi:MAG: helix-turn-helix transcriptional regulator [Deltaproteobacteria bacterium]|nr:helix-turn-helix transcriptional regulator [Deltaproteobacteria bacterium]
MRNRSRIGEVVREERRARGLTQGELADLSGTGFNFISQLERGKATVRLDKLLAVLEVLGLSLFARSGTRTIELERREDLDAD